MHNRIHEILKQYWGYDEFRSLQEEIILSVLEGKDTLALMPTGGGKSITYQVPALVLEGICLVVTPLIALMKDQVEELQKRGIVAEAIYTGMGKEQIESTLNKAIAGKIKFLYVSPERLASERFRARLKQMHLSMLAVDEAHCISQWGYDFRPSYLRIAEIRENFRQIPVLALTATATPRVAEDIQQQLKFEMPHVLSKSFRRDNIAYVVRKANDKLGELLHILSSLKASAIVYVRKRAGAEELARFLKAKGIEADFYHAGLTSFQREQKQEAWKKGEVPVIVATNAFGMGIDKSNVRWVIHYNLPKSIESFYQEIGRAGRDGLPSDTLLFYSLADLILLTKFAMESGQQGINLEKLQRMQQYAEADVCRRRILLSYFGEATTEDCGNCDVCKNPPQRFDGTVIVQKALSAIVRTEQQIGTSILVDILRGSNTPDVLEKGYQQLKTFGAGREVPARDWQDYLLQMLQLGYFEIAYNENNHLKITSSGSDVLFGRAQARLAVIRREESAPAKGRKKKSTIPVRELPLGLPNTESEELFEALRALRKRLADQEALPAYIVLSDKVLHLLSTARPTTMEAFGNISGIGEYKKKKYGKDFVELIRKYV